MTTETRYFFIVVSVADLIEWDETQQLARPNPYLNQVLTDFHINLDLLGLHDRYFDTIIVGQGDVFLYKEDEGSQNLVAFDCYKEPSDQLDLITIVVGCGPDVLDAVRANIQSFYDGAKCKVCLEESGISGKVFELIGDSNYPKTFPHSNYRQKLRVYLSEKPL